MSLCVLGVNTTIGIFHNFTVEILKRPESIGEAKPVMKFSCYELLGPDGFTDEFFQMLEKNNMDFT